MCPGDTFSIRRLLVFSGKHYLGRFIANPLGKLEVSVCVRDAYPYGIDAFASTWLEFFAFGLKIFAYNLHRR